MERTGMEAPLTGEHVLAEVELAGTTQARTTAKTTSTATMTTCQRRCRATAAEGTGDCDGLDGALRRFLCVSRTVNA